MAEGVLSYAAMSILTFLGLDSRPEQPASSEQTEAVREYILARVANADPDIIPEETQVMEHILVTQGQLSPDQAAVVVKMAMMRSELFGGTDNFPVTREFRRIATHDQKVALLDCLFAVSAASDDISMAGLARLGVRIRPDAFAFPPLRMHSWEGDFAPENERLRPLMGNQLESGPISEVPTWKERKHRKWRRPDNSGRR